MDNKEKLAAKKQELADVKEKMFALSPESEKAIERKLGILEGIALQKAHIEDTGLHISTVEKGEILENVKHRLDFHLSEKAIENTSIMVNLNTDHRGDSTLHFDSQKQKDDILNVLSNPQIVSTGGGSGVAVGNFLALTDTPSDYTGKDGYMLVVSGTDVVFTTNPSFATVTASGHIISSSGNIDATSGNMYAGNTIVSYGDITSYGGTIIADYGNVESRNGYYLKGKHMSAYGNTGIDTQFQVGGYYQYFEDGLLVYQQPV